MPRTEKKKKKNYGEKLCSFKSVCSTVSERESRDESSSLCESLSLSARNPSELIFIRRQARVKETELGSGLLKIRRLVARARVLLRSRKFSNLSKDFIHDSLYISLEINQTKPNPTLVNLAARS